MLARTAWELNCVWMLLIGAALQNILLQSHDMPTQVAQTRSLPEAAMISKAPHGLQKPPVPEMTNSGASEVPIVSPEFPAAQTTQEISNPVYLLKIVEEWRIAVEQHRPGKADAAAVKIGNWLTKDLTTVVDYITKLASKPTRSLKREFAKERIRRLFALTAQEARQGDINRILSKGALLHTDIALLGIEANELNYDWVRRGLNLDGIMILGPTRAHWKFARQLVRSISAIPAYDQMIRQWYIATIAQMQSYTAAKMHSFRFLGEAEHNLKDAMQKFPSDERILFYAGVLHETWASPINQNAHVPEGWETSYGSKKDELKQAKKFFQMAIATKRDFAEARLHLGRVLGLLGDHGKAVIELQQAAASIKDSLLLYYASLCLGYEFEMLDRRSEARSHYRAAADLYPNAQSPLLALSQLAYSDNGFEEAFGAVERVFALPVEDLWKDDPWWSYDLAHVRDAATLIEEMRRAFGGFEQ